MLYGFIHSGFSYSKKVTFNLPIFLEIKFENQTVILVQPGEKPFGDLSLSAQRVSFPKR